MPESWLRNILEQVNEGKLTIDSAVEALRNFPFSELGFAKVDHHRSLRTGFPEVILCEGKREEHILAIMKELSTTTGLILATRASQAIYTRVNSLLPKVKYNEVARTMTLEVSPLPKRPGKIAVIAAGTADLPVAEEAAVTVDIMGNEVERIYDVGVAGLHRLFAHMDLIQSANVLIVVAGMEGALPSVVGGLVDRPVIAVPTSTGYGASFNGLAALLGMLNSCAAGVTVVNIDNGFGAGYAASRINRFLEVKA